jgi:hypothetical protein
MNSRRCLVGRRCCVDGSAPRERGWRAVELAVSESAVVTGRSRPATPVETVTAAWANELHPVCHACVQEVVEEREENRHASRSNGCHEPNGSHGRRNADNESKPSPTDAALTLLPEGVPRRGDGHADLLSVGKAASSLGVLLFPSDPLSSNPHRDQSRCGRPPNVPLLSCDRIQKRRTAAGSDERARGTPPRARRRT